MTDMKKEKPLIILTAGGTGGHVYPAEALAEELSVRGYRLMLITDQRGKDNYKGKLGQIPNVAVLSGGIVGKSKLFKIKSILRLCVGILQALWVVWKYKPICVVGFGGYASFPACVAAILSGTDLVIHEQNSVMSRTNRFLSRYAELCAQSFNNVKYAPSSDKNIVVGMPIRTSIANLKNNLYPSFSKNIQILVLGGSQGAKVFGEVVPQAVEMLPEKLLSKMKIYQQCRKGDEDNILNQYKKCADKVIVSSFFENMADLYATTHIIISRSGASSVAELTAAGVPSVLIPLPTAADDHQTSNAAEIQAAKAGLVIAQKDFDANMLKNVLEELLTDENKLKQMSKSAHSVGITDAAKRLADAIEKRIIRS
ncbi:MAG: undecaprenyldiphospho-muramoylpentapeptide beta-N-acetylglucosaminyltransferase [Alphaproteobacteria bacterium]|nr:undecaprenyldiphospho-muramoylpentapeptide beta-N-acetylglucosaminyltransferase [Alphaproteobacteria bacterium]